METIYAFPPVVDDACRTLILGTAPSARSLREGFYYAHPRNAFWRLLADIYACPQPHTQEQKRALLLQKGIALWDVLSACARKGSLDAAIREPQPNDFRAFFERYPSIERVLFNGSAAHALFFRLCGEQMGARRFARLASTSPAYTLAYAQKLAVWRKELLT